MIAWNSTSKVTALPLPCMSVGVCNACARVRPRESESGCPGSLLDTNCLCREAARPRETRDAGGPLRSPGIHGGVRGWGGREARGAARAAWNKRRGRAGFPFFSLYIYIYIYTYIYTANQLGATLAKRDAFFIQPSRPGSVKLHFFSEAL